jgi:hypothetical protein
LLDAKFQTVVHNAGELGRVYLEYANLYPPDLTFGGCLSTRPNGTFLDESQPRIGAETMTDKKPFADRARDQTTAGNSPHAHRASERRRGADVAMKHFWPR